MLPKANARPCAPNKNPRRRYSTSFIHQKPSQNRSIDRKTHLHNEPIMRKVENQTILSRPKNPIVLRVALQYLEFHVTPLAFQQGLQAGREAPHAVVTAVPVPIPDF